MRLSTVGIWGAGVILLLSYLLSIRLGVFLPPALFWLSVAIIIGTLVFQIIRLGARPSFARVILVEIVVVGVLFPLIYQIPFYGMNGGDSHMSMSMLELTLNHGYLPTTPPPEFQYDPALVIGGESPLLFVLSAGLSLLSSSGPFGLVKWLPSFLSGAFILMLYLFLQRIVKDDRKTLLATLLLILLSDRVTISTSFHRQNLALVLMVCVLYLYLSSRTQKQNQVQFAALSILCLIGLAFSHHLTSAVLLLFLIVHLATDSVLKSFFKKKEADVTTAFVLIAFTVIFAYWVYIWTLPLTTMANFIQGFLTPGLGHNQSVFAEEIATDPTTIISLRGYIMFWGFYGFHLIFALMIAHLLIFNGKRLSSWHYSLSILLLICGIATMLILYVLPRRYAILDPPRLVLFGWLFGFVPLVESVLANNHRWLRRAGIAILVSFMLWNVYLIDPAAWHAITDKLPDSATEENYALAEKFDFSGRVAHNHLHVFLAIQDTQDKNSQDFLTFTADIKFSVIDWLVIDKKRLEENERLALTAKKRWVEMRDMIANLTRLTETAQLETWDEGIQKRNRIYESTHLLVFKK